MAEGKWPISGFKDINGSVDSKSSLEPATMSTVDQQNEKDPRTRGPPKPTPVTK